MTPTINIVLLGFACAWMAWVWTKEELFRFVQTPLQKLKISADNRLGQYGPSFKWQAVRKITIGLTGEGCFAHYPSIFFVTLFGYKMLRNDITGWFLAWVTTAFVANICLTAYSIMRRFVHIEGKVDKAMNNNTMRRPLPPEGRDSNTPYVAAGGPVV